MSDVRVLRIEALTLVVGELGAERAFYEALGFATRATDALDPEQAGSRYGVERPMRAATLGLGEQTIELVAFDPPGERYPGPRAANDPWFQHFAIAVSDMAEAYAAVSGQPSAAISLGGPQRLPPSTGSVTAYKFRDPEGHPLELSYIPGNAWTDPARPHAAWTFLGIDHTALAVSDLDRSLDFYVGRLGFTLEAQLLNTGPEQDRLDGLHGVQLDIAVLRPAEPSGPHLELLHYRQPAPSPPRAVGLDGIAATRTRLSLTDLSRLRHDLQPASDLLPSARRLLVRDPDEHVLELVAV